MFYYPVPRRVVYPETEKKKKIRINSKGGGGKGAKPIN